MEEKSYRAYMTDSAMCLCNLLSKNQAIQQRWLDLITNEPKKQDNRTAEEIYKDIKNRCNGGEAR